MNRIFRHKYTIFSLMAAMAMLMVSATGCIMEKEEPAAPDDGLMMVSFRVVTPMPKSDGASRADDGTWGGDYEAEGGSLFDNKLLSEGFKVIITQEDCTPVAEVTRFWCIKTTTENETNSAIYDFLGFINNEQDFDKVKALSTGKLHVIANAGTNPSLDDATYFTLSGQESTNGFDAIPMWGVKTVTNFNTMEKGKRFDAGDVWLLRAMAKVEILVSDDADNIITGLNSASLPGVNASGYLLPTGWATTAQTKDLTYAASYRPYTSTIATTLIAKPQDADKKKIVFYLPECENPNGDSELRIAVKYSTDDKTDNTGDLRFIKYDNGKPIEDDTPYNIVRNHLYRFTVTGINTVEDVKLSINYVVCPFDGNYTIVVPDFD